MKRGTGWLALVFASLLVVGCAGKVAPKGNSADALHYTLQLGYGYLENGQYTVALEKFQRALELDKGSSEAYLGLAETYARLGQRAKADAHYRRAIALAKNPGAAHNNYGAFLCAQGQGRAAEAEFLAALADPAYKTPAFAYTNAALCVRKLPDLPKAKAYLDQAIEIDPRFAQAWRERASLAFEEGQYAEARAYLERYHQLTAPGRDSLILAYRIELAAGNAAAAERLAARLKKEYGNDAFSP
jgi:type IV pilus assembly protein PilF